MSKRIACYPGSFDPITNGHKEIVLRALKLFDEVIILVADNSSKKYTFDQKERIQMVKESFKEFRNVRVEATDGLVVKKARELNCTCIVRGLRAVTDYEYEYGVNSTNVFLDKELETIFLMSHKEYTFLSSSTVRELYFHKVDISSLVPEAVISMFKKKYPYK